LSTKPFERDTAGQLRTQPENAAYVTLVLQSAC
jgi:hypothetical protein